MAAFAKVELLKGGEYEKKEYEKGAVLRVPSETAARWVRLKTAKAYKGEKQADNEEGDSQ